MFEPKRFIVAVQGCQRRELPINLPNGITYSIEETPPTKVAFDGTGAISVQSVGFRSKTYTVHIFFNGTEIVNADTFKGEYTTRKGIWLEAVESWIDQQLEIIKRLDEADRLKEEKQRREAWAREQVKIHEQDIILEGEFHRMNPEYLLSSLARKKPDEFY
jgi:hypothetical protein